ncbi:MAG: hypothetical protein AAGF59_00640 [Pseudomonadota bacterium]
MRAGRTLSTIVVLAGLCLPAHAGSIDSAYTKIDLDRCAVIETHELGLTWRCPGFNEIPVFVAESDLRFYVSFGETGRNEIAFTATPSGFNTINETLEWRFRADQGRRIPFATILRYFVDRGDGSGTGQALVVTRLGVGTTCHIGYVDARAVRDANVVARRIADEQAETFDCGSEPTVVGIAGVTMNEFWWSLKR